MVRVVSTVAVMFGMMTVTVAGQGGQGSQLGHTVNDPDRRFAFIVPVSVPLPQLWVRARLKHHSF